MMVLLTRLVGLGLGKGDGRCGGARIRSNWVFPVVRLRTRTGGERARWGSSCSMEYEAMVCLCGLALWVDDCFAHELVRCRGSEY